jgi:hypothetical protein
VNTPLAGDTLIPAGGAAAIRILTVLPVTFRAEMRTLALAPGATVT